MSALAVVGAIVVVVYSASLSFLLLARPQLFFEWFFKRRMAWWGLGTAIVDENRFSSRCRIFGWVIAATAVAAFWVLFMLDGGVF